jgi:type IV pilus assembly protein PilA
VLTTCDAVAQLSFFPGNTKMLKLRKGFTLIELLIVVVIIGILAAIAIPKFANTKGKAYKTAMISDLRNLVTAEEAFFSDSGKYSNTFDSLHVKFAPSTNVNVAPSAGAGYWYATATHNNLVNGGTPTVTCGIGMNTTNPTVTTAAEGEPACK